MDLKENSLMELTDSEVAHALEVHSNRRPSFSYNDVRLEIERRQQERQAFRVFILSIVAIVMSVLSSISSVLVAVFK